MGILKVPFLRARPLAEPPVASNGRLPAVEVPEARFAFMGVDRIAYQQWGEGAVDLVYVPTIGTCIDAMWDSPSYASFFGRLGTFCRGRLSSTRRSARCGCGRETSWIAAPKYDAVLTPTLAQPPAKVGGLRDDADPARDFENQKQFTPFTAACNMSGQPAMSIPLHWTDDDLPIGIQLVGRPGDEVTLLRLAAQLEADGVVGASQARLLVRPRGPSLRLHRPTRRPPSAAAGPVVSMRPGIRRTHDPLLALEHHGVIGGTGPVRRCLATGTCSLASATH
jgi:hypothetical protein